MNVPFFYNQHKKGGVFSWKKGRRKKEMPVCDEIIEKHMKTTEERLNDHAGRIRNLETTTAVTDEKVDNVSENLSKLTKSIYSLAAAIITALASFFIYAVQTNIFK